WKSDYACLGVSHKLRAWMEGSHMSEEAGVAVADFARVENGALAGRFVAQFWQPILKSDEIAPGRARRVHVLGKHYTVYRGEDGKARVVQDRCPHRGTSLAYGWVE